MTSRLLSCCTWNPGVTFQMERHDAGQGSRMGPPESSLRLRPQSPRSLLMPQAAHLWLQSRAASLSVAGVLATGDARASVSEAEREPTPLPVPEVQPGAEEHLPSSYLLPSLSASHGCTLTSGLAQSPGNVECTTVAREHRTDSKRGFGTESQWAGSNSASKGGIFLVPVTPGPLHLLLRLEASFPRHLPGPASLLQLVICCTGISSKASSQYSSSNSMLSSLSLTAIRFSSFTGILSMTRICLVLG